MKATAEAWDFITTLMRASILQDLEFDQDYIEYISLQYNGKEDKEVPCLGILTVADQIGYLVCITRIFGQDEPSFVLCYIDDDGVEEIPLIEIQNSNDVMRIHRLGLPESITEVLEKALADKEASKETCSECQGKGEVSADPAHNEGGRQRCRTCQGTGKVLV